MPIIGGIKVACEPCIRGHRSTKCNHANDRLMVPVRKPGRPLTSCPHRKDLPCNCGSPPNVIGAIPRNQKCYCGNVKSAPTPPCVQLKPLVAMAPALPAPTKATFRVQKLGLKGPRRSSIVDGGNLEKTSPTQFNIVQGPNAPMVRKEVDGTTPAYFIKIEENGDRSGAMMETKPPLDLDRGVEFTVALSRHEDAEPDLLSHSINDWQITPLGDSQIINFSDGGLIQQYRSGGDDHGSTSTADSPAESSCGSPAKSKASTQSITSLSGTPTSKSSARGCCSSKNDVDTIKESTLTPSTNLMDLDPMDFQSLTPDLAQLIDDPHLAAVMQQMQQNNGVSYVPPPQPTTYAYPLDYGSFNQPLMPYQWHPSLFAQQYLDTAPISSASSGSAQRSDQQGCNSAVTTSIGLSTGATIHSCACGDSCQCVGCAVHPYNLATLEYVRSAWQMQLDSSSSSSSSSGNHHHHHHELSFGTGTGTAKSCCSDRDGQRGRRRAAAGVEISGLGQLASPLPFAGDDDSLARGATTTAMATATTATAASVTAATAAAAAAAPAAAGAAGCCVASNTRFETATNADGDDASSDAADDDGGLDFSEEILSDRDFFFVSYPQISNNNNNNNNNNRGGGGGGGMGADENGEGEEDVSDGGFGAMLDSCPCGDDCECPGCKIHRPCSRQFI